MLDDNHSGMTSEIQKRISRRRMVRLTFSGAVHEWLLHLPRSKQRHLYVRLPVVEHVEVGILVDGERRVDPREDAGLAPRLQSSQQPTGRSAQEINVRTTDKE